MSEESGKKEVKRWRTKGGNSAKGERERFRRSDIEVLILEDRSRDERSRDL